METLEIKSSSAIAKVNFYDEDGVVGICFTSNVDKEYKFLAEDFGEVKQNIVNAESGEQSVGKLIHSYRKSGTLTNIEIVNSEEEG